MRYLIKANNKRFYIFKLPHFSFILVPYLFVIGSLLASCGTELTCKGCGVKQNETSVSYDPTVVGEFEHVLISEFHAMARCERGFGNLVTDAMLWKGIDAEIAFINAGSIRRNDIDNVTYLQPGQVTMGDLKLVFPYDNSEASNPAKIITISISGKVIKDALENSLSRMEKNGSEGTSFGRFLQVAGIKFYADVRNAVGSRILSAIKLNTGETIDFTDTTKKYRVAVPSKYIKNYPGFQDYDGYWDIFAQEYETWGGVDTNTLVYDATIDFIKAYTPIKNYSDHDKVNAIAPDDCREPYTMRMSIEHE